MAIFEQVFAINKSEEQQLQNNQIIYVDDLVLEPVKTKLMQLKGTVYAGDTGLPVNGVTIIVYNANDEAVATDETRTIIQDGEYLVTFNGEYNQYYGVTALLEGYDSVNQNAVFSSSGAVTLDFILPLSTEQNTIYGTVADANSNPIAGANVVIWTDTTSVSVWTAEDGTYIAAADFKQEDQRIITVSKFGYISNTRPIIFPSATSLEENFTLQLDPLANYTTISGQVLAKGGSPVIGIANALVSLHQVNTAVTPQNEVLIASMLTDAYGYYTFSNVPAGYVYIVRATKVEQRIGS